MMGLLTKMLRRVFMPPVWIARLSAHGLKNVETVLPLRMPFATSILALGLAAHFTPCVSLR